MTLTSLGKVADKFAKTFWGLALGLRLIKPISIFCAGCILKYPQKSRSTNN